MRKMILLFCLFLPVVHLTAQKSKALSAYAITGGSLGDMVWTDIQLIDLQSGNPLRPVFSWKSGSFHAFHARTGNNIPAMEKASPEIGARQPAKEALTAACAYDRKHNRLYYTPMYVNQLRYIDLDAPSPKVYVFEGEPFSSAPDLNKEENHITRMVIGADGYGYGLSNDGNHLVRFSTGKDAEIVDLGPLQDADKNGPVSVHNRCTSWGGDLVAAADKSLYLIAANHTVFRIELESRMAYFITTLKGLPSGFTCNGAMIDEEGRLVVSSASASEAYYTVDLKTWTATVLQSTHKPRLAADLASGNLAFDKENRAETRPLITRQQNPKNGISIYPNPVAEGIFRVSFETRESGLYEIQVLDLTGRILQSQKTQIGFSGQVVEVTLQSHLAAGTYLVKVLSGNRKSVTTDRIIVE